MPTLEKKTKKARWKGVVQVNGVRREQRFPDDSKKSKLAAMQWEEEERERLAMMNQEQEILMVCCPSILEWATEYLNDVQNRYVPKTYKEKKACFRKFIKILDEDTQVADITISEAKSFLSNRFKQKSGYAVNKERKNLAAAWTWGRQFMEGFPDGKNPFQAVPKFPEERSDRYVPPLEDFQKVLAMCTGQDRVILMTFFYTAARRGEIWNLRWEDIDFQNSRIRLWTRKRISSSHEFDWIPMVQDLALVLKEWQRERTYQHEYVFINMAANSVGYLKPFVDRIRFMKRICENAGVAYFGYHAIRHLTATKLYRDGHPVAMIQKVLRHKNPNTTARYLKSIGLEDMREALEKSLSVVA